MLESMDAVPLALYRQYTWKMHVPQNTAYAKHNGILIHVSEASRGASCGCVCVVCGGFLIAKKGRLRTHHFAHFKETNCIGAAETILHMLSKELIQEMGSIVIPPYHFQKRRKLKNGLEVSHDESVANGGEVMIDRVDLETSEAGFVPDVILHSGSKKLIIEIAVSNKVKREKLRRIRNSGLPAIEISLNEEDAFLLREELKAKLRDDLSSKKWLFHPKQREAERNYLSKLRDAIRKYRLRTQDGKVSRRIEKEFPQLSYSYSYTNNSYEYRNFDREFYEFHQKHGRLPTNEECLRIWPYIYKKF